MILQEEVHVGFRMLIGFWYAGVISGFLLLLGILFSKTKEGLQRTALAIITGVATFATIFTAIFLLYKEEVEKHITMTNFWYAAAVLVVASLGPLVCYLGAVKSEKKVQ